MSFVFKPRKAKKTLIINKKNCKQIKSIFPDNQVVFGLNLLNTYDLREGITCNGIDCNGFCDGSEIKSICVNCFMLIKECREEFYSSNLYNFDEGYACPRCSQETLVDHKFLEELIETEYYKNICDLVTPRRFEVSYSDICDFRWCEECKINIAEYFCRLCNTELCSLCYEIDDNLCSQHDEIINIFDS